MIVKICGMREQKALNVAAKLGINMVGFIFAKKSPRYIKPSSATVLDSQHMARVGVFTEDNANEILQIASDARLDFIQLHGDFKQKNIEYLAKNFGKDNIIRVFWPARYDSMDLLRGDIMDAAPNCGLFLLDAGISGGGSGQVLGKACLMELAALFRTHKNISDSPVEPQDKLYAKSLSGWPHPWILAGGLNGKNVMQTINLCRPDGVDFNSGLELSPGLKDEGLMREALEAVLTCISAPAKSI